MLVVEKSPSNTTFGGPASVEGNGCVERTGMSQINTAAAATAAAAAAAALAYYACYCNIPRLLFIAQICSSTGLPRPRRSFVESCNKFAGESKKAAGAMLSSHATTLRGRPEPKVKQEAAWRDPQVVPPRLPASVRGAAAIGRQRRATTKKVRARKRRRGRGGTGGGIRCDFFRFS